MKGFLGILRTVLIRYNLFVTVPRVMCSEMSREAVLQQVWKNSYEAWISFPGVCEETLYLRPVQSNVMESTISFPDYALKYSLFAITAWNPMGVVVSKERNGKQNEALEMELKRLETVLLIRSFGFSEAYREDGFTVAFRDNDQGRDTVIKLALKYKQGAIYEYTPTTRTNRLLRKTVAAAMNNVESETEVEMIPKSELDHYLNL